KKKYTELMEAVQDELDDLNIEIQNKHPQLASLVVVNPANVKEIQQLLDKRVGLLAYYVLPDETIAWWLTKDQIKVQRLPINRSTLQQETLEYRRRIQNLEPLLDQSKRLYQQLIAPFSVDINKKQVIGIVPHGNLHYLSFATLHSTEAYLIDKKPLFYLPSASILRYTLSRRGRISNRKVLALGNPDVKNPEFALPFSEQEVNSIHWNFPDTTVLTGKQATEGWLTQNINEFGIIHIASHGEFDPINPLFSALKLSPSEQYDGNLLASEIFGFQVNADLVLLSACQTGLGRISLGDDVVGLNRSFFYAGTHSIISSLWKVSDISTALLTKRFYREYKKHNKADALRKATLHVKNRYSHPGYWGAFTLAGDYQ
ncbi:MAG: CHAT domain-containing protein, partial [Gammaproteobacteria bacterium]|nr:CHAT domain-containing protein [Gammaproteobacteria bacterium]